MPVARFQMEDGRIARFEVPDGTTPEQAQSMMQEHFNPTPTAPAAVSAGKEINGIPRQLGLTARYGLEGVANAAQLVTEPLRYVTDRLTGSTGNTKPLGALATDAADWMGLPKPEGANERVIGDASRLLAGSGGMLGAASAGAKLPGMASKVFQTLAVNPAQQLGSAAGAGLAGGASREAGGGDLMQGGAALLGSVAGGMAPSVVSGAANLAKTLFNKGMSTQDLDLKISAVLQRGGVDYSQVPERVRQSMRQDMASALQADKEIAPAAAARLLDFRRIGATPTRGMLSQDPVQITKEMNLAKTAANSSDDVLHGLPRLQNQNNATLIRNLNEAGAGRGDAFAAGESALAGIMGRNASLEGTKTAAYSTLEGMPGFKAPISPIAVSNINKALGEEAAMPFMPKEISNYMESFIKQDQPFTPQAYNNIQKMLSGAATSQDGNVRNAVRIASQALERSPITPLNGAMHNPGNLPVPGGLAATLRQSDSAASDAIAQLQTARAANRSWRSWQESSRPIEAAIGGAQPDNFIKRFVIGGTLEDARSVAQTAGIEPAKNAILAHLKDAALSKQADEYGKFSQAAYNKAMSAIGDRKLSVFFQPEELDQLRAVGRAATAMQNQPIGSAVNNSNSGAMLVGKGYDALKAIAGKVPFGQQMILDPLNNIDISIATNRAKNALPGLLQQQVKGPAGQHLLLPAAAFSGGLLSSP